jgi:hypothetical protein
VAHPDGESVVTGPWIANQIRWANEIFQSADVAFALVGKEELGDAHARLESRADRHALGASLKSGVINCYVVQSLRDVDDPSRFRMGVHWRPREYPGKHLVIVSAIAAPTVLAHELGHFFGNRQHPQTPGNIMSYNRGSGTPRFDGTQKSRIRRFARRFLRTGELVRASQLDT